MKVIKGARISLFDLVMCLSDAIDLVSPALTNHHKQVAYIASCVGAELGLGIKQQNDLILSGAFHDIGSFSLQEKLSILQFRFEKSLRHAELSSMLLRLFQPFSRVAEIVRFHHVRWDAGTGSEFDAMQVPLESHILHLADRVTVLVSKGEEILGQVPGICEKISEESGKMFVPIAVDAFKSLSARESFWLDAVSPQIGWILSRRAEMPDIELDADEMLSLAKLFTHIIDFRSPFTATHSSGIAASAEALARLAGFSERECRMMKIAGFLHDLGKLAVPVEILEKNGKLTPEEFNLIRSHTFHTYRLLERISALDQINAWGAFHHERLDGKGYPFRIKGEDLPLGSRIMAVADVFTAITEDRPYRKGMPREEATGVLERMCAGSALDAKVVDLLKSQYDELSGIRAASQEAASLEYQAFRDRLLLPH